MSAAQHLRFSRTLSHIRSSQAVIVPMDDPKPRSTGADWALYAVTLVAIVVVIFGA